MSVEQHTRAQLHVNCSFEGCRPTLQTNDHSGDKHYELRGKGAGGGGGGGGAEVVLVAKVMIARWYNAD